MSWKIHKNIVLSGYKDIRCDMVITFLVASFLFLSGPHRILAQMRRIELNFNRQTLSAKIREAPLREVIATIE